VGVEGVLLPLGERSGKGAMPLPKNFFRMKWHVFVNYGRYLWGQFVSGDSFPCPLRDLRHFVDRLPKCKKKSEGGREFLTALQKTVLQNQKILFPK